MWQARRNRDDAYRFAGDFMAAADTLL